MFSSLAKIFITAKQSSPPIVMIPLEKSDHMAQNVPRTISSTRYTPLKYVLVRPWLPSAAHHVQRNSYFAKSSGRELSASPLAGFSSTSLGISDRRVSLIRSTFGAVWGGQLDVRLPHARNTLSYIRFHLLTGVRLDVFRNDGVNLLSTAFLTLNTAFDLKGL